VNRIGMRPFHPLANLFPMMEGAEFAAFVADVRQQGRLIEPITLHDDQILDGRNRERACEAAGVAPRYETFTGDDPVAFVISKNLARRHLNESQRAMIAARLATLKDGQRQVGQLADVPTQDEAGSLLNVGERSVRRAREVIDHGVPELIAAVDQGKFAVSAAASFAQKAPECQKALIAEVLKGAKTREAERIVRNSGIAAKVTAFPKGKFRVILCDMPVRYNDTRAGLGAGDDAGVGAFTAAEDHYPTMSMEELAALDVKSLAADDCVLLCWATFPLLPDTLEVVKAWGFTYKTAFVWEKGRGSFGHYHKCEAELLLICTRGSCTPDSDVRENQIQRFPRGAHSRKPEAFRALIDRLWPHGPRIELFARGAVPPHWTAWGAEAVLRKVARKPPRDTEISPRTGRRSHAR
jgi:N6-adenosine-specific RNA methylase IME4